MVSRIQQLLGQARVVRRPCDLDLLTFLLRHPRALLTSKSIARFLGYSAKEVAASLEALIEGGFLERSPTPAHAARLYVLAMPDPHGKSLLSLLKIASTSHGRQRVIRALKKPAAPARALPEARGSLGSVR